MLIESQNLSPLTPHLFTRHFLIVPIIFQKNIQAIFTGNGPENTFGFIFGSEKENYRIVKRIWPLQYDDTLSYHRSGSDIFRLLPTPGMPPLPLIGCFHAGPLSLFLDKREISSLTDKPFSDIRIHFNGKKLSWHSTLIRPNQTSASETVLL